MAVTIIPDPAGISALERSAQWQLAAEAAAADGLAYAQSIAPVDTGAYRDSLEVVSGNGVAYIQSTDPGGLVIEIGGVGRTGFHVLSRTIDFLENQ